MWKNGDKYYGSFKEMKRNGYVSKYRSASLIFTGQVDSAQWQFLRRRIHRFDLKINIY